MTSSPALPSVPNLDLGPDGQANHLLSLWRGMAGDGEILSGQPILPGVFFSLDPDSGTSGRFRSSPGELIEADFIVPRPARWLGLHIALGGIDLSDRQAFGVVCKSAAPAATTFRFCLRSGRADGFTDTFLRKTVLAHSAPSLHLDALLIDAEPDLPRTAPWRELILFFPPETGRITLHDLRLFII